MPGAAPASWIVRVRASWWRQTSETHRKMTEPGSWLYHLAAAQSPELPPADFSLHKIQIVLSHFPLYILLLAEIPQIDVWIKAISIKISTQFFINDKLLFKSVWKSSKSKTGKPILKENNFEDFPYQIPRVF